MSPITKRWTLKETEFLKKSMTNMTISELQSHLPNRTEISIKHKLSQLFTIEHVEKYKEEIINDYINNKIGIKCLVIKYGFNPRLIGKALESWNVELRYRNSNYKRSTGKCNPAWRGYEDIPLSKFNYIKLDADKRGLLFDITIEQIWNLYLEQDKKCALSGTEIIFSSIKSVCTASLDRINSNIGYIIDNVQWVHKNINIMKNRFSDEEYIKWCKLVVKTSQEKEEGSNTTLFIN